MKKISIIAIIFLFINFSKITFAENPNYLDQGMYDFVFKGDPVYKKAIENPEEFMKNFENDHFYLGLESFLYDKANAYLKLAYDGRPSGCGDKIEAAGFRKNDGTFLFLKDKKMSCLLSHQDGLYSTKNIIDIMPEDFNLNVFMKEGYKLDPTARAAYYLEAKMPQKGTDLIIQLKQIPFGLKVASKNYLYLQNNEKTAPNIDQRSFPDISICLLDPDCINNEKYETMDSKEQILLNILNGNIEQIKKEDKEFLMNMVGMGKKVEDWPLDDLRAEFKFMQKIYELNQNLAYDTLTLTWDRKKERFVIKNKNLTYETPKLFKNYLKDALFFYEIS